MLAGQSLGIKEVDDGIWLVSFMHYDLGYIDLEQKTLQPLDNPFGPRLSPMSRYALLPISPGGTVVELERVKGFEPSTPTLAGLCPSEFWALPGGVQPTSWGSRPCSSRLFPQIREPTKRPGKFTVAQQTGRGAVPIKLDRGNHAQRFVKAHSVRSFLFVTVLTA